MKTIIGSLQGEQVEKSERYTIDRLIQEAGIYNKTHKKKVEIVEIIPSYTSLYINLKGDVVLHYYGKDGQQPVKLLTSKKTDSAGKTTATRHRGSDFRFPDIILSRLSADSPGYGLTVLNQICKAKNIKVINKIGGVVTSRDKFRSLQVLTENGFKVPRSVVLGTKGDIKWAIEQVGGFPIIMKLNKGTQGLGVMRVDSMQSARSVYDLLKSHIKEKIIIQEFFGEEVATDYRVFVVGDKVVAGMKRVNKNVDEFRANIHAGAVGEPFEVSPELQKQSIKITQKVGLDIAGVDFILTKKYGFIPIEVNSSPGSEGIEKATKINVAKTMLDYIIK